MRIRKLLFFSTLLPVLSLRVSSVVFATEIVVERYAVIRDDASGVARRLGTAQPGERFTLLSDALENNWYQIDFQGQPGWIYGRWVRPLTNTSVSNLRLASFNTLHLGWENNKDISMVANILSSYDIVALQEVMKEPAVSQLVDSLESVAFRAGTPVDWDFIVSDVVGRSTYLEAYAFLWRTDRVSLIPGSAHLTSDPTDLYSREPFVASFKAGNFDYNIMSVHFAFDSQERTDEAKAMATTFRDNQDSDPSENDLILVGDFNLSSTSSAWSELLNLSGIKALLQPPVRTSIGETGMSKLYDNIWFQSQFVSEFAGESGTNEFMHSLFEDDVFRNARAYVSDHVPIYAVFRTDQPDDD